MAWYRCGGGGLPAGLQSDMDTVLNKKFSTSTTYPPTDWPDTVNLMGPLPEKTASGAIANITDGADDVPVKSCVAALPASIDGYASVTAVRNGKNLFDKNNANIVDGYITTTGFSTANVKAKTIYIPIVGGATYTVGKTAGQRFQIATAEEIPSNNSLFTSRQSNSTASSLTITAAANDKYLWAWIFLEDTDVGTLEDMISSVQIEVGSASTTYSDFITPVQYSALLGRLIYGGEVDIVNGTGKEQYQKVKVSDLTWQKSTASGKDFFIANISEQENANTHDVAIDITGLTYAGMVTVAAMNDKSLAKWLQSVRIYDTSVSTVSDLLSTYGNGEIVFYLKDTEQTDFTFTPITPTPETALGVNNFWADEGDSDVTYRADISLALQALGGGGRGLMMMRPTEPEETEETEETEGLEDELNR